jgi:adenine-specific DNA-methyltransferase
MNHLESKQIIEACFESNYDEANFKNFIVNILKNDYEEKNENFQGIYIKQAFQDNVKSYKRLFKYESKDKFRDKIDVLTVNLKSAQTLQKYRSLQRNFIANYLESRQKDAVLVAFYCDETPQDWKFSLISRKINIEDVEVRQSFTSAKRMSFLVGKNEKSHTAKKQFLPILEDDNLQINLKNLEEAFSCEKVTDEFFEKYKELFLKLKEALELIIENDQKIKKDFAAKEISSVDFVKKTLGQMAFLYFLQKKGWFGVLENKDWGSGDKNFLRQIFNNKKPNQNFFNDILEPLFYEALAQDRGNASIYEKLKCRMPFLNGGLFEPLNGYLWETTNIILADDLFSNQTKTKDGDIGDGILDIFDRYNFTVNENEPLEKEVAVDPEMLGKVFENLLEIKDRKSKGAFYTPREIVHYMCQESLINYLNSNLCEEISQFDLEFFIKKGDEIIENDQKVILAGKETDTYKFKLPAKIRDNTQKIDQLLANVKVCDPAVGSGAFPLGMLNEIVKARQVLEVHLQNKNDAYQLKLHAISNSIYGVDIDSGAVEIAKLRLWLALVVEEKSPTPLPNLDHKIMQGNSLLSEFEGIKLFDDEIFEDKKEISKKIAKLEENIKNLESQIVFEGIKNLQKSKNQLLIKLEEERQKQRKALDKMQSAKLILSNQDSLFENENHKQYLANTAKNLQEKIKQFIFENQRSKKENLKAEIDNLKWQLIEASLQDQGKQEKLIEVKKLREKNIRPFFIWKLEFCDVFSRKKGFASGFDVVIGNPPYIKEYTNKAAFSDLKNSPYYMGKMDLWYFFACYGLDLLKENGVQAFIAPNNWVSNFGAKIMREKLLKDSVIDQFIDFGNYKVFDTAGIQTMVYILNKNQNNKNYQIKYSRLNIDNPNSSDLSSFLDAGFDVKNKKFTKFLFNFKKEKFEGGNIYFLDNEIDQIIEKILKKPSFNLSEKEVAQGIVMPQDFLNKKNQEKLGNDFKIGDGIFTLLSKEKDFLNLSQSEQEIIKPYFTNENFYRYSTIKENKYWIIYTDSKFKNIDEIEKYPNIKKHLEQFKEVITSDNKPYGLHRARNEDFFKKEKIIVARKCLEPVFSYNDFDCYVSATFYVIKTNRINLKFLTAFLNSKLVKFWLKNKGKMQGNNFQIDKEPLCQIFIPKLSPQSQQPFINLVDEILAITASENYNPKNPAQDLAFRQKQLEAKIDEMVFDLYNLSQEERDFICKF